MVSKRRGAEKRVNLPHRKKRKARKAQDAFRVIGMKQKNIFEQLFCCRPKQTKLRFQKRKSDKDRETGVQKKGLNKKSAQALSLAYLKLVETH